MSYLRSIPVQTSFHLKNPCHKSPNLISSSSLIICPNLSHCLGIGLDPNLRSILFPKCTMVGTIQSSTQWKDFPSLWSHWATPYTGPVAKVCLLPVQTCYIDPFEPGSFRLSLQEGDATTVTSCLVSEGNKVSWYGRGRIATLSPRSRVGTISIKDLRTRVVISKLNSQKLLESETDYKFRGSV